MYPGFIVEFDDQSDIPTLPIEEVRHKPLFGTIFTSDKGTEDWFKVTGEDFFKMYGKSISFKKHGQALLQSAVAINAGAELLCKRLVADDAALANIGIVATVSDVEVQAADADGNLLYEDADGNQTTETTDTPVMTTSKSVKYSLKTATSVKTVQEAFDAIQKDCGEGDYLLFVISDNGRGVSKKRIKFVPHYRLSKSNLYTAYRLSILENNEELESMTVTVNPNIVIQPRSWNKDKVAENISVQSMIRAHSQQLKCVESVDNIEAFFQVIADACGIELSEAMIYDPLFLCNNKGEKLKGITLDKDGIDLQYTYGQTLQSGDNGAFGNEPILNEEEWTKQAIAALDGTYDKVIFNLDQYMLTAWVDANYPYEVKRAVETLATFREDFMYFRDQGLDVTSIDRVDMNWWDEAHNMFCATYPQSYEVLDPYTRRPIKVTIGYSLAKLLVQHCDNGCILPTAGIKHGMIIDDCIYGTLSIAPTICPDPDGNQKEQLDDLRANYASYIDNQLVIEALYTSQERYTQWSFVSNVMGIQEVVKALRRRCPAIRYSFIDGEDLEMYKAEVEEVLAKYRSNFKVLELEYKEDATYSLNKIFYAVLKVVYRDFVQTEWFKVTALISDEVQYE